MEIRERLKNEQKKLEEIVCRGLEYAKKSGVTEAYMNIGQSTGLSVSTLNGDVENIEFNKSRGMSVTVYSDGRRGRSSTSDLSKEAVESAVDAAYSIARHTSRDPDAVLPDDDLLVPASEIRDLDLCHPSEADSESAIALLSKTEKLALAMDPRLKRSHGADYGYSYGVGVMGNTHGFCSGYPTSSYSISLGLIGEKDGAVETSGSFTHSRYPDRLMSAEELAREAADRTLRKLGPRKVQTMRVPIILENHLAAGLFGVLASAISGRHQYQHTTFLDGKLGEKVLPDWVTVHENPFIRGAYGSSPFDDEGVRVSVSDIVSCGKLSQYLLSTYTARKLGMRSNGHCGGIYNWFVTNNTFDGLSSLLKMMGKGIFVTSLMGEGASVIDGNFSRGAFGFWVEDGEIRYPVHEFTVAGNMKDVFSNMVAMANDYDPRLGIQSGSVLIDDIAVAGI
ncbi:MAG: metalloprotease PmbA [Succinivibrionaceae bacterium]|jgi:PmbA protein|nr:metalloprotease PmbA [Pseudomonadota bacterium]MDY6273845.1 metalloprotease PmbA [Succinivibrionaceae bacterium]MDY6336121.1 metalloprotease PmbA [Succinivibrionaceae bacterium]MDY6374730.1 metalloprotease PmbA [Succinivibrionaceae bacterium]